jgi:hypothetical protein
MREYTLVDCKTMLIYGPYETSAMARAHAEAEAITTWEIITDDDMLVDWCRPDTIAGPKTSLKEAVARERAGWPKRFAA